MARSCEVNSEFAEGQCCGSGGKGDVALTQDGKVVYWILEVRCWQWGTAGVAFPCQTQPVPEGSQGSTAGHSWAGPLSAAGGTAVVTYLRKGKMLHGSEEKIVRNSPASSQAEKEEEGEDLQVLEQAFPLSPWGTMLEQVSTVQPWGGWPYPAALCPPSCSLVPPLQQDKGRK